MKLSTIIPEHILPDRNLLTVYCYCIRNVQPVPSKLLVKSSIVSLRPYEVCIIPSKAASDLDMEIQLVVEQVQKLVDLDLIESTCENELTKIKFKYLVLPSNESKTDGSVATNISDCWFDEFIPEYLEYVKTNLSQGTHLNYHAILNAFSKWMGRKRLSDILPQDLEKYKNQKKGTISDNTINIHVRTLITALELAKKWGKLPENPFRGVKQIRTQKKSTPSLQKDEYTLLRSKINEQWLIDIIDFDILTGLRIGELCNLKWAEVDLEKGMITIQSDQEYQVKHGKMRTLPLHDEAKLVLSKLNRNGEYVFLKDDGTCPSPQFVSKKFKSYIRAAGLPEEYHFHSLRATFATWCANKGMSGYTLQNLMGHSSMKVTEGYLTPDLKNFQQELSRISLSNVSRNS
jgi:integrase